MNPSQGPRGAFRVINGDLPRANGQDVTIADMVREGIRKAQEKLIDLSMRNPMLNFKHSETSARHVRIADEQISVLAEALVAGKSFDIVPVPPVEEVPSDENTEAFREAFAEAKKIDPEWLAAEDARRAAGNRRRSRDKIAERALRNRVRSQLGMSEWKGATDPKVRAKELGIHPEYDLPLPSSDMPERHLDDALQTLHFPDRLEAKLSTIYSNARALQEDAGLSALHAAIGFLEWYDSPDSTDAAFAPLLLLPISMSKRVSLGDYVYSIRGRDDDEATNTALREKLKHLSLDLPEYDPEEEVETYLSKVSACLVHRPRWRVRRFVTIGLFSFSRQVMWSDLDQTKWPANARPESHVLLSQIYGDIAGETSATNAVIYDVDRPEMEAQAPALITDADASQLSAVIDATSGKNLVIQGPPGTGKSQAITNIIANALWQGKTVLFVSEKMAALNVVKNRLDSMNLGQFCLEVHSAKASKSLVLKALRERIESPRTRGGMREVERARAALQEARQRLTEYAVLINSPAGETGLTIHAALWADFVRANDARDVPPAALEFRLPHPLTKDSYRLRELLSAGRALDELSASMGAFAEPNRQPWRGLGNLNLTRFDRAKAVQLVGTWTVDLERIKQLLDEFCDASGWQRPKTLKEISQLTAIARGIPDPVPDVDDRVLSHMLDETTCDSLERWSRAAIEIHETANALALICAYEKLQANRNLASRIEELAHQLQVGEQNIEQLARSCAEEKLNAEAHSLLVRIIDDVLQMARVTERSLDAKSEAMVAGYLHAAKQFSTELLNWRSDALAEDDASDVLSDAAALAVSVNGAATEAKFVDALTLDFAGSLPLTEELRRAASVFRGSTFWSKLFSGEYRAAKATWRRTFPGDKRIGPAGSSRRLLAAARWREAFLQLEGKEHAKRLAGRHWKSADTPFEILLDVADWLRSIRRITPITEAGAEELRRLACGGTADEFSRVLAFAEAARDAGLLAAFQAAYEKRSTIHAVAAELTQRERLLVSLRDDVSKIGLLPGQEITAISSAFDNLQKLENAQEAIKRESASGIASEIPAPSDIDRVRMILATLSHAASLKKSDAPSLVIKHLSAEDCSGRTASIKKACAALEEAIAREHVSATNSHQMLELRFKDWVGGSLENAAIETLLNKCREASLSPGQLEKQIDLLSTELEVDRLGLGELARAWPDANRAYSNVAWSIEAAYYRSVVEKLMHDHPVLARHAGNTHEQTRKSFQQLDREILVLNRQMIAEKLFDRPIPPGRRAPSVRDYTDHEMINYHSGLQQPRIALRRLFSNAGNAIRGYTPCIMMSPMSVAQYLEPGKHVFDLLVIDEASQMRPEDALSALLRSKQAVVVGDPLQLPPTDFFNASNESDDQEADDGPEESILELGCRCWHPMRMLEVHYRSRHQSLIAYSNREFYDERLLVYPSPVLEDPDYGVSCQRVEGIYETGQGRNRIEAEAVVEEAARLMRTRPDRSIGIVAINQAQSELIDTIMDQRVASDPDILAYRQKWESDLEYFFVKNLENVQGDERDTILISTVYGKTSDGAFHQRFGPITRAYGHRRLNVLFTRAKRKLTVFTSLDHGQIVADGKSRGVRVLKEFLEYAQSGTVSQGRRTGAEPDSDFEKWFLSRLKEAGYEAHPQVGVAKYRIDIGIVHPDKLGSYILGLECDGATYHSSKSARDRDRLRQHVLEELNWNIHRVWSTDWYRNPEREFSRLVQRIESLRAG